MNELEAGNAFDQLFARTKRLDLGAVELVLRYLDEKRISSTEAAAFDHYSAEGTPIGILAERAREVATGAVAGAHVAGSFARTPGLNEPETLRRLFQDAVVSFKPSLAGAVPPARVRRLLGSLVHRLLIARAMLERAEQDQVDASMAVRDFVEAAALGALLAELAEAPTAGA